MVETADLKYGGFYPSPLKLRTISQSFVSDRKAR